MALYRQDMVRKEWRAYTTTEDKAIIKYILKQSGPVNGNQLWIKLENKKLIPGRSWMSMRNRFLRSIMKNLNSLVDQETCAHVRLRAKGDFNGEPEAKKPSNLSFAKKRNRRLSGDFSNRPQSTTFKKDWQPCLAQTNAHLGSRKDRRPFENDSGSTTSKIDDDSSNSSKIDDDSSSSSKSDALIFPKKARKMRNLFTKPSNDVELTNPEISSVCTNEKLSSAVCTVRNPFAKDALPVAFPKVSLYRCDAVIGKDGVKTSPTVKTKEARSDGPESKFLQESAETARQSCSHDFDDTDKEKQTLSDTLCGRAELKTEPEDGGLEPTILYMDPETEQMCMSSEDDDEDNQTFIDPLYAQYVNKEKRPYVEVNGCKLSLGPLPFPVVYPW